MNIEKTIQIAVDAHTGAKIEVKSGSKELRYQRVH